jgi:large subunit ribosomal protein L35
MAKAKTKNKMKTRKAAAKRFTITASGKIKRKRKGLRHILEKRSPKNKRQLKRTGYVDKADTSRVKRMLGKA